MSIELKLGGANYKVPPMNLGQIEDLSLLQEEGLKWTFKAFGILMRRAEPAIEDIREIEVTPAEIGAAVVKILEASGYSPNGKAPEPQAPGKKRS